MAATVLLYRPKETISRSRLICEWPQPLATNSFSVVLPARRSHIRKKRLHIALEKKGERECNALFLYRPGIQMHALTRKFILVFIRRAARYSTLSRHTGAHCVRQFHENSTSHRNPITAIRAEVRTEWQLGNNNRLALNAPH